MKTFNVPAIIKVPAETESQAIETAMEIILGGIDMLSDRRLKERIKCEFRTKEPETT